MGRGAGSSHSPIRVKHFILAADERVPFGSSQNIERFRVYVTCKEVHCTKIRLAHESSLNGSMVACSEPEVDRMLHMNASTARGTLDQG